MLGDRRWNDRWPDRSLAAIKRRHSHYLEVLAKLKSLDRAVLPGADQLNYDLFLKDYRDDAEAYQYRRYLMPVDQRGGIQTADELADSLRFESLKDYEDWLARLRAFPAYMDQTIVLMRQGIEEKMILPRIVLQRIPSQIDHQIVSDPKASPFYKPFRNFFRSIAESDRGRITAAAEEAISESIVPEFERFEKILFS